VSSHILRIRSEANPIPSVTAPPSPPSRPCVPPHHTPIHNNDEEPDLRHVSVGRNNCQILGSERGGQVACRMYSLVLSCKHAGVDPQAYIEDVLGRISTTKTSEIATLTPWASAAARKQPARATLSACEFRRRASAGIVRLFFTTTIRSARNALPASASSRIPG
jgi:hypothetical protein